MGVLLEVKVKQAGYPGAPGWTSLFFDGVLPENREAAFAAVHGFFTYVREAEPGPWSAQLESEHRLLDSVTGALIGFEPTPVAYAAPLTGTGSLGGSFGAGVAGACISWATNTVGGTRRIRGRTFIVPLSAGAWQSDGTLLEAFRSALIAEGEELISNPATTFGIWHRPVAGAGGIFAPAISARVNDKAAFLTSRRQ